MDYTFIASASQILWRVIDSYGLDPAPIFREAGLDPARWDEPYARFDNRNTDAAWVKAIETTNDPCIGLRAARFVNPASLYALGFAWLASSSLHEALGRLVRFYRVISDGMQLELSTSGDECQLAIDQILLERKSINESLDAFWAAVISLCRMSTSESFAPLALHLQRPKPVCHQAFAALFQAPVHFGADRNRMVFRRKDVERLLPTGNKDLAGYNDKIMQDYLGQLETSHFPDVVRCRLVSKLVDGGIDAEQLAQDLHMSRRTLQRRLAEEQTSYTQLLDEARRELALRYVDDQHMPVKEITYLLGFSEPANFTRAFKRWTGVSPSEYRGAA